MLHIVYSGLGGTTNYVKNWLKAANVKGDKADCLFYGVEQLNTNTRNEFNELCDNVDFIRKRNRLDIPGVLKLRQHLKKGYPNVILHIDSLIIPVKKFSPKNSCIIFVEHQSNELKNSKRWFWSKMAQKKATFIVSFTSKYLQELKEKIDNFQLSKNLVIETGIDITHYISDTKPTHKLYGAVGRLNSQRDFESLILAFNQLDETYQLVIAGDGEDLVKLKKIANPNIAFLGNLSDSKIVEFLNKISVFIKPSFGESLSIAIMEAQAAGLPIIAWNVPGINNILNDSNAILVEPKNIEGIKKAIVSTDNSNDISTALNDKLKKASTDYANEHLSHLQMYQNFQKIMQ